MRRNSSRPWPALVDLFSALFIIAFAGFVLLTGRTDIEVQKAEIRSFVDELNKEVQAELEQSSRIEFEPERRGDDLIFDLYIEFAKDDDAIKSESDRELLRDLAGSLRRSIEKLPGEEQQYVQVVIEGHTDNQQPRGVSDPRVRYLFNWNLSSLRATSVLYEFKEAGLSPEQFSIVAIGYADSEPRCTQDTPTCHEKNRRTSLRLSPDMARIEKDFLSQSEEAGS